MNVATLRRLALLLTISFFTAGCELIGDIFEAGFVTGIIIVVLILAVVWWLVGKFRGRRAP